MNDTVPGEALAELRALAGRRRLWLGLFAAAALIGLTGPFGTYDRLDLPLRLSYWALVTATTWWLAAAVCVAVAVWAERRGLRPPWLCAGAGAAAASLPAAGWLGLVHGALFEAPVAAEALRLLPYVLVISVVLALLVEALEALETWEGEGPGPAAAADGRGGDAATGTDGAAPAWLDQLPPHLGRDLILLQAQDHYVRAETALGEALIRARLQDAAEALGERGVRVHRSWWVARGGIAALRHRDGAPVAVLRDGREIPVGRTYRRAAREALR